MSNLLIQFDQHQGESSMKPINYNQFRSKYRLECLLARGGFGTVEQIQDIRTKQHYALKKITVKKQEDFKYARNQIQLLSRFRNPHLVQFKETYEFQINPGYGKPFLEIGIIMELGKRSLDFMIKSRQFIGSISFVIDQIVGLIKFLYLLQQQKIAHRDIKPANIIVVQNEEKRIRWKLADFGLAIDLMKQSAQTSFVGSERYASPGLLKKLKYKEYKLKTNSFKDDVYSLGITLIEILTGSIKGDLNQLQTLYPPYLIELIDMMVEKSQQKRPCFKQLMIEIENKFPSQRHNNSSNSNSIFCKPIHIKNYEEPKESQLKYKRNAYNFRQVQQQDKTIVRIQPDATQVDRQGDKTTTTIVNTQKPIQCLVKINEDMILCGEANGSAFLLKNQEVIQCGKIHKFFVTNFVEDKYGNIWSIGGDNEIKIWNRSYLENFLKTEPKIVKIQQCQLLRPSMQKVKRVIDMSQSSFKTIKLNFDSKGGISFLYCQDEQSFAVGFYNGSVYIKFSGQEYYGKLFQKPITCIKLQLQQNRFWISSLGGMIKTVDSTTLILQNVFHQKEDLKFVSLFINNEEKKPIINALSINGSCQILSSSLQTIYIRNFPNKSPLLSAVENKSKNTYYILSETGEVFDSNEKMLADLEGRGWSCLSITNFGERRQLIAGSFNGQIAFISSI